MMRASLVLSLVCLVAVPASAQEAEPQYFPLAVGRSWVWNVDGREETSKVVSVEKKEGIDLYSVEHFGGRGGTETFSVEKDGVHFHVGGGDVCILQFPIVAGAEWSTTYADGESKTNASCKNEGVEDITVPAGTFSCVKISVTLGNPEDPAEKAVVTFWFAKDVGPVKITEVENGKTDLSELKSFAKE